MADDKIKTTVNIGKKTLPFPVLVASGTFGYGEEYQELLDYKKLGAIIGKTITKEQRPGNTPPRIQEVTAGSLNSIGLANLGMKQFAETILPTIAQYPCPFIANIAAKSVEEFVEIIEFLEDKDNKKNIWGWELNLSCPNVSGGTDFGKNTSHIHTIVSTLVTKTSLPIIVKLPPNVSDIGVLGLAAQEAGAAAISAVNTFKGMWIDTLTRKPVFEKISGGLSGPAIFSAALALVYDLVQAVSIPVIGIGGIYHTDNALQFLLVGASAVQVGTASFRDPYVATDICDGIIDYCKTHNFSSIKDIKLAT